MDTVDKIIRFENGEMTEEETIAFLTELRDSGLLFSYRDSTVARPGAWG